MDVFGSRKTIFVGMLCLFSGIMKNCLRNERDRQRDRTVHSCVPCRIISGYLFMYLGVDGLLTTHHAIAPAGLGLTLFFVGLGSRYNY